MPVTGTHSILVSSGGMTPAYCSPEQQSGTHLTRRTDIWSWAVSVLEIFAGEVDLLTGCIAEARITQRDRQYLLVGRRVGVAADRAELQVRLRQARAGAEIPRRQLLQR